MKFSVSSTFSSLEVWVNFVPKEWVLLLKMKKQIPNLYTELYLSSKKECWNSELSSHQGTYWMAKL